MASVFTYSFESVTAAIVGPNGAFSIGYGAAVDEGGISVEMAEDKGSLVVGSDGEAMHVLNAGRSGRITVRFLKTSPTNGLMQALYDLDTNDPSSYGQNTITITDTSRTELVIAQQCGQVRFPGVVYGKQGAPLEWSFNCAKIHHLLNAG